MRWEGPGYQTSRIAVSQVLKTFNCHRRKPKQDLPGRLSGDFRIHKLEKIVGVGEGKKKYPARQCKVCAVHQEHSGTGNICKFCVVLLYKGSCFQKYHLVTNC